MADLRIFLADDHAVVREGLKSLIDAQPDMWMLGNEGDGNAACELVPGLRPDVVITEVSMPGMASCPASAPC